MGKKSAPIQVQIRMTPAQKRALAKAAKAAGTTSRGYALTRIFGAGSPDALPKQVGEVS